VSPRLLAHRRDIRIDESGVTGGDAGIVLDACSEGLFEEARYAAQFALLVGHILEDRCGKPPKRRQKRLGGDIVDPVRVFAGGLADEARPAQR
jgi:hypothetical protein